MTLKSLEIALHRDPLHRGPLLRGPLLRGMRSGYRKVLSAFALSTLLLGSTSTVQANVEKTYVFGIVPQQSATRLAQIWIPVFEQIGTLAGVKIKFATAKDIPSFEACLAKGAYDFAYMNPYHFTNFHEAGKYHAFARQADKRLRGVIVVRKDSPYKTLDELQSMSLAFPSPAAFGASVIPRAEMKRRGLPISPVYVKSHDSVYRSVVAGLFPAGGGVLRTLGNVPQTIRDQLRVLYKTDAYTPHAFAAHANTPQNVTARIADVMEAMSIESHTVLKPLGMKGFQKAGDADWDDVRALNLTKGQTEIVTDNSLKCHSG